MASKFTCLCGEVIRTNLFSGHGVKIIVPEEELDLPGDSVKINTIVIFHDIMVVCKSCGRISIIDKNYSVKSYKIDE